jgi:hypothetical protein
MVPFWFFAMLGALRIPCLGGNISPTDASTKRLRVNVEEKER